MSTAPTGVLWKAPRTKSKGARPVNAIKRSTITAIEEAVTVGCGLNLRRAMTAEAAYYLAERRGFEPGHELDDWLQPKLRSRLYGRVRSKRRHYPAATERPPAPG